MGVIFMIESASKWFSQGIVEFFLNPWKFRNRGNETRVLFFAKKNKICWTKQRWITRAIDILNNIITQKVLTFYIFILELYFRINSLDEGVGIIFTIESASKWFSQRIVEQMLESFAIEVTRVSFFAYKICSTALNYSSKYFELKYIVAQKFFTVLIFTFFIF